MNNTARNHTKITEDFETEAGAEAGSYLIITSLSLAFVLICFLFMTFFSLHHQFILFFSSENAHITSRVPLVRQLNAFHRLQTLDTLIQVAVSHKLDAPHRVVME